jgi:Tol biopolymer transport system component/dienelactone hydrolase
MFAVTTNSNRRFTAMKKVQNYLTRIFAGALACTILTGASIAQSTPKGSITIDRIAAISYPTDQAWSPDGKQIAFLWDFAGKQNLYVAPATGGTDPVALTNFEVNPDTMRVDITKFQWSTADQVLLLKNNQMYTVSISDPKPVRLEGFDGISTFTLSRDKDIIAFVRKGDVWVGSLKWKTQIQLTHLSGGLGASSLSFSKDGQWLAFGAAVHEQYEQPLPFNGEKMKMFQSLTRDGKLGIVPVIGGDTVLLPSSGGGNSGGGSEFQWVAGPALVVSEVTPDRKTRELQVIDIHGQSRTLWTDHDPAWFSAFDGAKTTASPDGKLIAFESNRSGWQHLYVIPTDATSEKQARQLSTGNFIDGYPTWSRDSKYIAYSHSAADSLMERFISVVDVNTGKITDTIKQHGLSIDPSFSPDGRMIAFTHSTPQHPVEVYSAEVKADATPVRLTVSMSKDVLAKDLTVPQEVHFRSRADDKMVPGALFVNKDLDKTKKHPAIVWIHGSGEGQNYLSWQPGGYRNYYAMHEYLAQQGYVILTVNYRGNSGDSRDWSTGSYMDQGGKDYLDIAGGADYLKTLSYVDPDRIGVWGLSYGGFLTLQAVTVTPDLFRCAIDVAGVANWATYFPEGNVGRQGSPVTNPELYFDHSPVNHLDKLNTSLLIAQGTNDSNQPFAMELMVSDKLEKLGKPFEMIIYPGEIHFFRREYVLKDFWRRSEDFFNRKLMTP